MRFPLLPLLVAGAVHALPAQTPTRDSAIGTMPVLSLEEAQTLARRNNPTLLQTLNNRRTANAALRSARGAFLPQVNASFSSGYRQGGQQLFNGAAFGATSDIVSTSYDVSVGLQLNSSTFINPKLQSANVAATEADITGTEELLRANVTQQYLEVLKQEARAALQDTLLLTTQAQLELARARSAAGAGTLLDVQRAEVANGQVQVALLQARNQMEIEKLKLFQELGVDQPRNVRLTTSFPVVEPSLSLDQILDLARRENPTLNASRARERAASLGYRNALGQIGPTLTVSTGWGGYTSQYTNLAPTLQGAQLSALRNKQSCLASQAFRDSLRSIGISGNDALCSGPAFTFTDADAAAIRAQNSQYPFNFTKNPWSVGATLSIPVFNGFTREQRVQEAAASRDDARYFVRSQELALRAGVGGAYLNLTTARQTVALQEQNAKTARAALLLVEEQYRAGAKTFVDVAQARSDYERAESDRINAVYDYQKAFAALESAVGRSLR
jgi:outer membrane protein